MDLKELVYKIESIKGVSVHLPSENIISIGNGSSYNPRVLVKEIVSLQSLDGPLGEPAVEITFIAGTRLFVTEMDFAFTIEQDGFMLIEKAPPVISISEVVRDVNLFTEARKNPNLDAVEGLFYQVYYALKSAVYLGFEIDRLIARFYADSKELYFFERDKYPLFNRVYLGNRGLNLQKLKVEDCFGILDFINFWKKFYSYGLEDKYNTIYKNELKEGDIITLYEWKNGMKNLSTLKMKSLKSKIIAKIDLVNSMKNCEGFDLKEFLYEFKAVSAVWKIFLLHIIKPQVFPIYDQHIHRAFLYINDRDFEGINASMNDNFKLSFYFDEYLPFVRQMEISDLKQMDEAFFAFGQFLNLNNQKKFITQNN